MQSTDDDGIVFSTACLCLGFPMRTDWYLRVEKQSTTPVQALAVQPLPDARRQRVIHSGMTEGALQAH